jgi:F-type H+-transporting ATPase subunit a
MNIVYSTIGVTVVLTVLALLVNRAVRTKGVGMLQNIFELFTEQMCSLIKEIVRSAPEPYVPLVATLFLFVFVSNMVGMIPGLSSPTGNISVTAGLAVVVMLSVPIYGIRAQGVKGYIKTYAEPNVFMMPFNLLGEVTRTLSLAVRLFGNVMSGELLFIIIVGVVMTVLKGYASLFIPFTFALTLFISILSLITAAIQAYIFTVLALVYIGGAVERRQEVEAA